MRYDKEQIIAELGLSAFGSQGWLSNKNMECPFCGKKGKWGVIFNETGGATFHCWKCPRKTTLYEFLKKINRLDLAKTSFAPKTFLDLGRLQKFADGGEVSQWMEEKAEQVHNLKPVTLPLRMKPLVHDAYLDGRGFKEWHYKEFEPSYVDSSLEPKLHNYIIFKMKMNGICVAWWARSRHSKEWHKENLEAYKRHEAELVLRYRNSENNFRDLLGGYDELVKGETKTVIITEGIFDKIGVDNLLNLHLITDIKCCFTFGNSIGEGQVFSLLEKGVENIYLLYDYGTIKESKETALRLREFFDVKVAAIKQAGIDPGNIDAEYLNEVLGEASDPVNFFANKLEDWVL